ncbi:MAG: hypothetical protein ACRDGM_10350 [bacterium]
MGALRTWMVVATLGVTVTLPLAGMAADSGTHVGLVDVHHVLDGRILAISGRVENRGPSPVAGLVVDAIGYAPIGDPVFLGSDGIPWGLAAGKTERFTVRLPLTDRPVRVYTLQVALSRTLRSPLVSLRRSVEPNLYQPLLSSAVQLKGSIRGEVLTVQTDVGQWPAAQVTVQATISVPVFQPDHSMILAPRNIDTLIVRVPGNGAATAQLGTRGVELLFLRVIDAQPFSTWGD